MEIVKIISEHKKIRKNQPLVSGHKRVEAIVDEGGAKKTKHIDIKK